MLFVIMVAIVIAVAIAAVVRQPDPVKRAILLRRSGFGLMALSTVVFGAFIIGEAFADPGGWKAAGLLAAWAVPLAGLAALSWFRPGRAIYVLAVLRAALIGVSIWSALSPNAWRSSEDRNGPVRAVITFVLAAGRTAVSAARQHRHRSLGTAEGSMTATSSRNGAGLFVPN